MKEYTDYLLDEYNAAYQSYRDAREKKERTIRVFAAILVGLITFALKGDLPDSSYLFISTYLYTAPK